MSRATGRAGPAEPKPATRKKSSKLKLERYLSGKGEEEKARESGQSEGNQHVGFTFGQYPGEANTRYGIRQGAAVSWCICLKKLQRKRALGRALSAWKLLLIAEHPNVVIFSQVHAVEELPSAGKGEEAKLKTLIQGPATFEL